MPNPIFDAGFNAERPPTPAEVSRLGTSLTALRGQAQGYAQRQVAEVNAHLGAAEAHADAAYERVGEAIGNELGDVGLVAIASDSKAQQALTHSLLSPTETALAYGYRPQGAPGQGKGGRGSGRGRRKRKGVGTGLADDPPTDPATADTPTVLGSGALPFDPAPPLTAPPAHGGALPPEVPQQWAVLWQCDPPQIVAVAVSAGVPLPPEYQGPEWQKPGSAVVMTASQMQQYLSAHAVSLLRTLCRFPPSWNG